MVGPILFHEILTENENVTVCIVIIGFRWSETRWMDDQHHQPAGLSISFSLA